MATTGGFQSPPQEKKRGYLFYGCLTAILLLVALIVALYFGVKVLINRAVDTYSSETAVVLPTVAASKEDYARLRVRIENFRKQPSEEPLRLKAHDLNTLIMFDPFLQEFRDRAYLSIAGQELRAQISFPLEPAGFEGRFVNGTAGFRLLAKDSRLQVELTNFTVNDVELPSSLMSEMSKKKFGRDLALGQETQKLLPPLDKVEIENDTVVFYAKH